jgi:hypothetical protein
VAFKSVLYLSSKTVRARQSNFRKSNRHARGVKTQLVRVNTHL